MEQNLTSSPRPAGAKEAAILEAVFRLLNGGRAFHELTVSEIAAEAGIGKGTVYEYFPSKDAILENAVFYRLDQVVARCQTLLSLQKSFDETLRALLDEISRLLVQASSDCWPLLSALVRQHPAGLDPAAGPCPRRYAGHVNALCDALIRRGRAEGLVGENHPQDYLRYVFTAVILSFVQQAKCAGSESELEQAQQYASALCRAALR